MIFTNQIKAGLSFKQAVNASQYPAPDWTLKIFLRGPQSIDLEADENHIFKASAETTATWQAGLYAYTLRAYIDEEVFEIETGQIEILPDLQQKTAGYDSRTHAEKVLEAIEALLEKKATSDQQRYVIQVDGSQRELWRFPHADLIKLRQHYLSEVQRERARRKGVFFTSTKVRFTRV